MKMSIQIGPFEKIFFGGAGSGVCGRFGRQNGRFVHPSDYALFSCLCIYFQQNR